MSITHATKNQTGGLYKATWSINTPNGKQSMSVTIQAPSMEAALVKAKLQRGV